MFTWANGSNCTSEALWFNSLIMCKQAATGRLRKSKSDNELLFTKRLDYTPMRNPGLKGDRNFVTSLIQRPLVSTETSPRCPQNLNGALSAWLGAELLLSAWFLRSQQLFVVFTGCRYIYTLIEKISLSSTINNKMSSIPVPLEAYILDMQEMESQGLNIHTCHVLFSHCGITSWIIVV